MKKILLSFALVAAVLSGKSQLVFNEFYTDPGAGNGEFIEFYNQGGGTENTDGYVVVTFYEIGANKGFYVFDLPSRNVAAKNVFTAANTIPFNYQGNTYNFVNFDSSWAWSVPELNSYILDYRVNGAGTGYLAPTPPSNLNDVLLTLSGATKFHAFLFNNGFIVNGLSCNGPESILPSVRSCPALSLTDPDGAGPAIAFTINWNAVAPPPPSVLDNQIEYVNAAAGNDNGYKRLRDGQCGQWIKSSSQANHTPGKLNGAAGGTTAVLTVSTIFTPCVSVNQSMKVDYSITGGPASAFPVTVKIWEDLGTVDNPASLYINELLLPNLSTAGDITLQTDAPIASAPSSVFTYNITPTVKPGAYLPQYQGATKDTRRIYLVFGTPAGCFDQVREAPACAVLPVTFKSFTATRNSSNVIVKWETATEVNSSGFAVERNINGIWEQVAFVSSQAAATAGNSSSVLSYQFVDLNNTKGITQYRIRQIDLDEKSKFSEIRSVRGDGQKGKTIIYPNPTADGRVNIVFEETNVSRDITVSDMAGRTVKQLKSVTANNITIENLTPGMYSLRIMIPGTGEQTVEKIVVNKR